MITCSTSGPLALVWAVCIILLGGSHVYAQNAQLPDAVRVALERYAALDPLAVTWSQKTEATEMGKQKLPADKLARIVSYNTKVLQIAFRAGRIYVRSEGYGDPRLPLENSEFAFDGNVFYLGTPLQTQRKYAFLKKLLPQNDWPQARYFDPSYFRAAGIKLPTRIKELASAWHPQSELLALLAEGGQVERTGTVTIEGRSLMWVQLTLKDESLFPPDLSEKEIQLIEERQLIPSAPGAKKMKVPRKPDKRVAPLRRHDFYLDPEYGYAVRQHEIRDEARHFVLRSDCSQFEQLADRGIWLPRRCRLEEYTFEGVRDEETKIPIVFEAPLYVCEFLVKDFDLQPWPYERFELKYQEPGTRINDGTFPGVNSRNGVSYTIPADSQRLESVIDAAKARYFEGHEGTGKRNITIKTLFLVINGIGLSILVFYLIVRRLKKASSV
jgi:hypothetical protein